MTEKRIFLENQHKEGKQFAILWIVCGCCAFAIFRSMAYIMTFMGWTRILLLALGFIPFSFFVMGMPPITMGLMYYFGDGYFTMGYRG